MPGAEESITAGGPPELKREVAFVDSKMSDDRMDLEQAKAFLSEQLSVLFPPERRLCLTTVSMFGCDPFTFLEMQTIRDRFCNYVSVYSKHFNCKLEAYDMHIERVDTAEGSDPVVEFVFTMSWTEHNVPPLGVIHQLPLSKDGFNMNELIEALNFAVEEPLVIPISSDACPPD